MLEKHETRSRVLRLVVFPCLDSEEDKDEREGMLGIGGERGDEMVFFALRLL